MILRIIDKQTKTFLRDDFTFNKDTEIGLDAPPASGFYSARWDGTAWAEAMSRADIDAINTVYQSPSPTIEERVTTIEETIDVLFGGAV